MAGSGRSRDLGDDAVCPDLALVLRRQVARIEVPAGDLRQRWPRLVARLEAVLAARMERAARWRMEKRRRRALDRAQHVELLLDRRHRLEQPPRVRMLGAAEDLRGGAVLHRP